MDGSSTNEGSRAGLIVVSPKGHTYEHALKFLFKELNNEARYETFLASMDLSYAFEAKHLRAFFNSQLIVSQVKGEYEAHDVTMVAYLSKVKERLLSFKNLR